MWSKKLSSEEKIAERKRIHERGMGLFILFNGVFGFGVFTFFIDLGRVFWSRRAHSTC